jgi:hypothetical protein
MARLYSYTLRYDDGAAPNPFREICTLAICKPDIRRVAQVGDWIAGLGGKDAPSGDLSGQLIYAMRVSEVVSMEDYDRLAPVRWPHRIPDVHSADLSERLGDCIYQYSGGKVSQRPGVHGPADVLRDLSGHNVLISTDFYYFGSKARPLPPHLMGIIHQTQKHKSIANDMFVEPFVRWIRQLVPQTGQLYGWPDHLVDWNAPGGCGGCSTQ